LGEQVHHLGVRPPPIPFTRLGVENLAQPIELSVHDPKIRQTARMMGEKIQNENGVSSGVLLIQDFMGNSSK